MENRQNSIEVVNIGGPLFPGELGIPLRSLRSDFRHVDLVVDWPNTILADVNLLRLSEIVGDNVRFIRASNVPFAAYRGIPFVDPTAFVRMLEELHARHAVVATGVEGIERISAALRNAGWVVRVRRFAVSHRTSEELREMLGAVWEQGMVQIVTARKKENMRGTS